MTEERVLGPIGTEVVFENDRVRVWEMRLAPGEASAVHRHELDYMLVQLEGDRIAAEPEPDTEGAFDEYLEADVVPGAVVYIDARRDRDREERRPASPTARSSSS